jgi:hypothetical protein
MQPTLLLLSFSGKMKKYGLMIGRKSNATSSTVQYL